MSAMNLRQYAAVRGNQARLAKSLGVTHAAIRQWVAGQVPAARVLAVESMTGIHRAVLRPDLYPPAREPIPRRDSSAEAAI